LLVGLTAHSLTAGGSATAAAFALAAGVFVSLLVVSSLIVSTLGTVVLKPVRTSGPTVKRFSGFVLLGIGIWFVALALAPTPLFSF
jgi:hypothetical protein